jgi:predicted acyl esterase
MAGILQLDLKVERDDRLILHDQNDRFRTRVTLHWARFQPVGLNLTLTQAWLL